MLITGPAPKSSSSLGVRPKTLEREQPVLQLVDSFDLQLQALHRKHKRLLLPSCLLNPKTLNLKTPEP